MKTTILSLLLLLCFCCIQCTKVVEPVETVDSEPLDLDGIVSLSYTTTEDDEVLVISFNFLIEVPSHTVINIRNVTGYVVKDLFDGQLEIGLTSISWDLTNNDGDGVIKGPYLLYVKSNGHEGIRSFTNCLADCY